MAYSISVARVDQETNIKISVAQTYIYTIMILILNINFKQTLLEITFNMQNIFQS